MIIVSPLIKMVLKLATIVLFLITAVAAFGGKVDPDIFPYFSWLTLVFPYLAIASLIATVVWVMCSGFIMAGMGVVLFILIWSPFRAVCPINMPKEAVNPKRTFTLMSYNVLHGIDQEAHGDQEGNRSFEFIINSGADIVALQELVYWSHIEIPNFTKELDKKLREVYPYRVGSQVDFRDLKLMSKYPIKLIGEYGYFSHFVVQMPWGPLNVINVHLDSYQLDNRERAVFKDLLSMKRAKRGMSEMKGSIRTKLNESFRKRAQEADKIVDYVEGIKGALIVCGDFNDVPTSWAYNKICSAGLEDAYEETGFGPLITFNRHAFFFHLDQILYRPEQLTAIWMRKGTIKSSDHYPVMAEFEVK